MSTFFYDKQVRRFLQQIIAVFSNFSVEFGKDGEGNKALYRVPVRYGDPTRMASTILKDNSENKMSSVPVMTVYITSLEYDRERTQDPTFVSKIQVRERRVDTENNTLSIQQGNTFTVERLMPVPYELNVNVDIWTSNTEQKLQVLEQILPLFNPDLEIQSTDNFIDWTSLSYIHLDNVIWSSRTIPVGTDDTIDVATLSFYIPIWLSAPAKVKKMGVIQTIINSIYDATTGNLSDDIIEAANLSEQLGLEINISAKVAETGIATSTMLHCAAVSPSLNWGFSTTNQYLITDIIKASKTNVLEAVEIDEYILKDFIFDV